MFSLRKTEQRDNIPRDNEEIEASSQEYFSTSSTFNSQGSPRTPKYGRQKKNRKIWEYLDVLWK